MILKSKWASLKAHISKIKYNILPIAIFGAGLVIFDKQLIVKKIRVEGSWPIYTQASLNGYNGDNPEKPVLLALDGWVYDISPGRATFYDPGKPYHFLAGTDASVPLHMFGGDLIRRKYRVVGQYQ